MGWVGRSVNTEADGHWDKPALTDAAESQPIRRDSPQRTQRAQRGNVFILLPVAWDFPDARGFPVPMLCVGTSGCDAPRRRGRRAAGSGIPTQERGNEIIPSPRLRSCEGSIRMFRLAYDRSAAIASLSSSRRNRSRSPGDGPLSVESMQGGPAFPVEAHHKR